MKKIIAVFLAVLMTLSCFAVCVSAADENEETTIIEISGSEEKEKTTRNIQNDDGLVIPINFKQLKFSVIFKIVEKIIKFILNLFAGDDAGNVDNEIATAISNIGEEISQAIEEGSQFIEDNTAA